MRVLNVIMTLDDVKGGGTVERTVQMTRHLSAAGVDCEILTTTCPGKKSRELPGIKVTALKCVWERFYFPFPDMGTITAAVKRADIIHIMNHWCLLNAFVYLTARLQHKPYVVCPAGALPIFGRSKTLKRLYNMVIGREIILRASHCIAITKNEVPHFLSYGVKPEIISIIPNGIDIEPLKSSKIPAVPSGPYITFLGRLNSIKGPDMLLDAFVALKNDLPYSLVFLGPDNGMLEGLRATAEKHGVAYRTHFAGFVDQETKSAFLSGCEFLVIPSRQEAMSIVVLEAAMASKPVLLTDQCGINQIEEQGGGVVVPATVEGLRDGLLKMYAYRGSFTEMGEKLNVFAKKNYAWEVITKKFTDLYTSLTS